MKIQERMEKDPVFNALVHAFLSMYSSYNSSGAGMTPTEIREASGIAWQIYVERNGLGIHVVSYPDLEGHRNRAGE